MKKIFSCIAILFLSLSFAYAEPSIHQVYEAAKAGQLNEAHQMVEEVLKAHPQSAKAHFVNAEILSAQGQITQARSEFKLAEQLEPGLPFAKPEAVQKLKDSLGLMGAKAATPVAPTQENSSFPWLYVVIFVIAVLIFIGLFKSIMARNACINNTPSSPYAPNGNNNTPVNPTGMAPQGGGLGSNIASGLATGLAAGVGIAAGEALVNHFMNNNTTPSTPNTNHTTPPVAETSTTSTNDFGGNDFGMNDSSSWDDASSSDSLSSSDDSW